MVSAAWQDLTLRLPPISTIAPESSAFIEVTVMIPDAPAPHVWKKTNFYRDVFPIFAKAVSYSWVNAAAGGVSPDTKDAASRSGAACSVLST